MKLSTHLLIFIILAFSFFVPIFILSSIQEKIASMQVIYNNVVDNAVDDALSAAKVEYDDGETVYVNKDEAVNCLFKSLYSGFGVVHDKSKQELMKLYIPVILFTEKDGYSVYSLSEYTSEESKGLNFQWSEKRAYSYEDTENGLIVTFRLDEFVSVYDINTGRITEGMLNEIKKAYPEPDYFQNEHTFDVQRRQSIINTLTEDMEYYINEHNMVAKRYGITYQFELPAVQRSDWYRTIDDIGMMVLFQGYPYSGIEGNVYNRYAVGSARIHKDSLYYVVNDEQGTAYYHLGNCEEVNDEMKKVFYSKKECANDGAYPHKCCR